MFHGYVDGLQSGRIVGWAIDAGAPDAPVVVEASAAGQVIGRAVTGTERNDVRPGAMVGFEIEIIGRPGVGGMISVTIAGTDEVLPGVAVRVPAPIGSIPRRPTPKTPQCGRRPVDVIVPVYRGIEETVACLQSVIGAQTWDGDLLIINDASPEPAMMAAIAQATFGFERKVVFLNKENRGFPYSVNVGMAHNPDRDVILLNSDAQVSEDWIDRLRRAAYSDHDIGTATALSNEASICSYAGGADQDPAEIDRLAAEINRGLTVDLPTAVGFCMFIRRDCLDEVGLFDAETFGRGYGEENDFCMRARLRGWRHVAAADVFVQHQGGLSFGKDASALQLRNGVLLEQFYPGYNALVQGWIAADPLRLARRTMDILQLLAAPLPSSAVLLIAPNVEGGVAKHLSDRRLALKEHGKLAVTLLPGSVAGTVRLVLAGQERLVDLVYSIDDDIPEMLKLLHNLGVEKVELHHLLGHDATVTDIAGQLGVPMEVYIHDFSWICPRLSLINDRGKFCGQPDEGECSRCAASTGARIDLKPDQLRRRSADVFKKAERVIAPSRDAAARVAKAVPVDKVEVQPWEDAVGRLAGRRRHRAGQRRRVCILGAIGDVKGYDLLLNCARDAARRNLPLDFALVGYSQDDIPLLATGRVTITARFREEEALDLIAQQQADIAFMPSIGPETWSYALSTLWRAGLEVIALDIGAQAERILAAGGSLLAADASPPAINDFLISASQQAMLRAAE